MNNLSFQFTKWFENKALHLFINRSELEEWLNRLAFNWSIRESLYRHLSIQTDNNISQINALESFSLRMKRHKRKRSKFVIDDIIGRMKNGAQLSGALHIWVPADEALTISGAEMAGNISVAFELLLQSKARETAVKQTMISAFTTPFIYLLAVYSMLWVIGMYFLPSIQETVPSSDVHGLGAMLYGLGNFATSFWMLLPIFLILTITIWVLWAFPNWTSPYRIKFENYFPFNFYRDIKGYIWLITFASMVQAGISDTKTLLDQSRLASPWLQQRLLAVRRRMINGEGLSKSLQNTGYNFPNPDMIDDIDSMADFDDFSARIIKRAMQWGDNLEITVKARIKILGFYFDMIMYALILLVLLGINSLSVQIGSVPGLN